MKKLITTFCVIALTTVVAQAQTRDADVKPAVKKEAPAKLMNNANSDAAQTSAEEVAKGRAEYEASKKSAQAEAATKTAESKNAPKKSISNSADAKNVKYSDENSKLVTDKKKKKDN